MTATITPGTYLRMRREAAGVLLRQTALTLCVELGPRASSPPHNPLGITYEADIGEMFRRLVAAEADQDNLTIAQAAFLRRIFPFDMAVYEALLLNHHGCPVPVPPICRTCACSWHDACRDPAHGPCAWSDTAPDLCTACERAAEWPDAPLPEGELNHG